MQNDKGQSILVFIFCGFLALIHLNRCYLFKTKRLITKIITYLLFVGLLLRVLNEASVGNSHGPWSQVK